VQFLPRYSQGRFSTALDFTGIEEHDHEDIILEMMEAFGQPFHGIQFAIPDGSYYETQDGLSWGVNPTYSHDWNATGVSEVKLQISKSETPTLPTERRPQIEQSYFRLLPSYLQKSRALRFPRSSPKKSAPVISATRRATSTISACSPRARSIRR
jgi:hypothetical protein